MFNTCALKKELRPSHFRVVILSFEQLWPLENSLPGVLFIEPDRAFNSGHYSENIVIKHDFVDVDDDDDEDDMKEVLPNVVVLDDDDDDDAWDE
ncbi:hypothetical protein VNO77_31502 [Canavalia gladiata]|uniref:Uncharacterized protein n=1 Tax=Canavalia gladiata TaxID=3824 RepID=A0AAN9KPP4_CANGL